MDYSDYPVNGKYGRFGGSFVPETLVAALSELSRPMRVFAEITIFNSSSADICPRLREGQPLCYSPKTCRRNSAAPRSISSVRILLTAAPIRSTIRSARLFLRSAMGKTRVIAETGAGQHGVATAIACAALGLKSEVYGD